jgi:hypothetical protein
VLLRELFLFEAKTTPTVSSDDSMEKYGRPFNHPEHLVFFKGARGTLEALQHIKEIAQGQTKGEHAVRRKWDGNPQIYWGRETKGGPLILVGHNQWSRGFKTDNQHDLADFILNKSGNVKTPEDFEKRKQFATNFSNLYPLFDAATPKDFVGFVYADNLFGVEPDRPKKLEPATKEYPQGIWTFCPNPLSDTCYHVDAASELGRRVAHAHVMVTAHGFFPEFGMPDRSQTPKDNFNEFNRTPGLIVQGPIFSENEGSVNSPAIELDPVDELIQYTKNHQAVIDGFLDSLPDADKNGIFYPFFNQKSNEHASGQGDFGSISGQDFIDWMTAKGKSPAKIKHIIAMTQAHPGGLDAILHLIKNIRNHKDELHNVAMAQPRKEIWDTNGEGHVRYPRLTGKNPHKFGATKWVPTTWAPGKKPAGAQQ